MVARTTSNEINPTRSWMDTPPRFPLVRRLSGEMIAAMPWLDKVSQSVKDATEQVFGQPRTPAYKVKDFLAGVWFGHPVHPALVTIPIGAWTSALILNLAWLSDEDEGVAKSADILMWVGNASAVGSAATGIANWVDTDGLEQRTGVLHALLNGSSLVLNVTSGLLSLAGQRRSALALSSTAYALTIYSAFIGGELAYANAIGVNRVAAEGGSDDYVAVIAEEELTPGKLTRVDAAGIPAVLIKDGTKICAIAATCSHLSGPLDEGSYEDGIVYCPWHSSGFRMCDGSVVNSPAVYAQPTFAVRVRDGMVELRRLEHA